MYQKYLLDFAQILFLTQSFSFFWTMCVRGKEKAEYDCRDKGFLETDPNYQYLALCMSAVERGSDAGTDV